jgi:hypothetical protein
MMFLLVDRLEEDDVTVAEYVMKYADITWRSHALLKRIPTLGKIQDYLNDDNEVMAYVHKPTKN